jgi:hypothetical protein
MALVRKSTKPVGGLCFDEMEIRSGLTVLKHQGYVLGMTDGALSFQQCAVKSSDNVTETLANRVCQVFFVSTDGSASFPIYNFFTKASSTADDFLLHLKLIIEELKVNGIDIHWCGYMIGVICLKH